VSEAQNEDGIYVVDVEHAPASDHQLWEDAICLLSAVAEDSFHVRRVDRRTVECVTGMLDGDGEFASHGHAIRLRMILREVGTGALRPRVPSQWPNSVNEVPATVRIASHERRASSVSLPDKDGARIEKGQNDGKIGSGDLVWKPQIMRGDRTFAGISLPQVHSVHLFGSFPPSP
jgi:hypothetical protein